MYLILLLSCIFFFMLEKICHWLKFYQTQGHKHRKPCENQTCWNSNASNCKKSFGILLCFFSSSYYLIINIKKLYSLIIWHLFFCAYQSVWGKLFELVAFTLIMELENWVWMLVEIACVYLTSFSWGKHATTSPCTLFHCQMFWKTLATGLPQWLTEKVNGWTCKWSICFSKYLLPKSVKENLIWLFTFDVSFSK